MKKSRLLQMSAQTVLQVIPCQSFFFGSVTAPYGPSTRGNMAPTGAVRPAWTWSSLWPPEHQVASLGHSCRREWGEEQSGRPCLPVPFPSFCGMVTCTAKSPGSAVESLVTCQEGQAHTTAPPLPSCFIFCHLGYYRLLHRTVILNPQFMELTLAQGRCSINTML
jgi:hypothetical protein